MRGSRGLAVETLEARRLLMADLFYSDSARDLELQRSGDQIQIVDAVTAGILQAVAINEIDQKIEITGRSLSIDSEVDLDDNSLIVSAGRINLSNATLTTTGLVAIRAEEQAAPAGAVLADAVQRGLVDLSSQSITITGTSIVAQHVELQASGKTTAGWHLLGAQQEGIGQTLIEQLEAVPQLALSNVSPITGQAKFHNASATIEIIGSVIDSQSSVDVSATASANASLNAIAVTGINASGSPATLSVGLSDARSSATIEIGGTTQIKAAGGVRIATNATSTATNISRNEANSILRSEDAEKVKYALNASFAFTSETSTIDLGPGTVVDAGGAVSIDAEGNVTNETKATTALFRDGTAGFSLAIGVDEAIVRSTVAGRITSGDDSTSELSGITAGEFSYVIPNVPAANPIRVGETLVFRAGGGDPDSGLIDDAEYIVRELVSTSVPTGGLVTQEVRLARASSIPLDHSALGTGSTHSLSRLGVLEFDASAVSQESGSSDGRISIAVPDGVTQLTYLGPDVVDGQSAPPIAGLVANQTYEVDRINGQIKLRLPGESEWVDFVSTGEGPHGFRFDQNVQSFDPLSAVNSDGDWIELPAGHGLQTGDFVLYRTDPTKSVTRPLYAFDADGNETGLLSEVVLPDAPIDGLQNNFGYYVIVDPIHPERVRLSGSYLGALSAALAGGTSLASDAVLVRQDSGGVSVTASLQAINKTDAGTNLTNGDQPWTAVAGGIAAGQLESIFAGTKPLFDALVAGQQSESGAISNAEAITGTRVNKADGEPDSGSGNGDFKIDLAGSVAVSIFDHVVEATIADGAVLQSAGVITVDADIVQRTRMGVVAESTRNGLNEVDEDDKEFAAGIGYAQQNNISTARVNAASIDAAGAIRIDSQIIVPFLGSDNDGVNAAVTIDQFGLGHYKSFLSGSHGLSGLVNVYSQTLADGDDSPLSLAIGIIVTEMNFDADAIIASGARINRDAAFQAAPSTVDVVAALDLFHIEAAQMSALNLSAPGFAEAALRFVNAPEKNQTVHNTLQDLIDPFGVSGKDAAGGTSLIHLGKHRVNAEIQSGAEVTATGVSVDADSNLYSLALVQTGTRSSRFGLSAAVAAANLDTETVATIGESAVVDAESLTVDANDRLDRIAWLGAVLLGKQTGVGASVGVNVIAQHAAAAIGRRNTIRPSETVAPDGDGLTFEAIVGAAPETANLNIAGDVRIRSTADGDVEAIVIAGALQGIGESAEENTDTTVEARSRPTGKDFAIALTGSVAVNDVHTTSHAFIDTQNIVARDLDVQSESLIDVGAVVVGASFAVQLDGRSNSGRIDLAGAGAVAINVVDQENLAIIHASTLDLSGDLSVGVVNAETVDNEVERSSVHADAGGFGIVLARGGNTGAAPSFGASFAINDLQSSHLAQLIDSDVDTVGQVELRSVGATEAKSLAIGGALSARANSAGAAGTLAAGGAYTNNSIDQDAVARIVGGSVETGGSVQVIARDTSIIEGNAGGFAIGASFSNSGGAGTVPIGVGISLNEVNNTVLAGLESTTLDSKDLVEVAAESSGASITSKALAASVAVAGAKGLTGSLAGAGAGAENRVVNQVLSRIIASDVTVVSAGVGGLLLSADDATRIDAMALGASLGAASGSGSGGALTVGVSIAVNEISSVAAAEISEGSTVTASDSSASDGSLVSVLATQSGRIESQSVAATIGASGNSGATAVLSGGGSVAQNRIGSDARARVVDSSAAANLITVQSTSDADIAAGVFGAFVGLAGSGGVAGTAAIGVGIAENFISFDRDDGSGEPRTDTSTVEAIAANTNLSGDRVRVESLSLGSITTQVLVTSVALAAAARSGIGAAGSGAVATNRIARQNHAGIKNNQNGTGRIRAIESLVVNADDQSTISANVLGGAVSFAGSGAVGGTLSIGVSSASNKIANEVVASIEGVRGIGDDDGIEVTRGALSITASQASTITSSTTAIGFSAAVGNVGVGLAGAGGLSWNDIQGQTIAMIDDSDVAVAGASSVTATEVRNIEAHIFSGSASVGGGSVGIAASIGVGVARNSIGNLDPATGLPDGSALTQASVRDSSLDVGSLNVQSSSASRVEAQTFAGTFAAAFGQVGIAGAGAGVRAENHLAGTTLASIDDVTGDDSVDGSDVIVRASDTSTAIVGTRAAAVAAAAGQFSFAMSIGISLAENAIDNQAVSRIRGANVRSTGSVTLETTQDTVSDALATATGAAASFGISISGGGADADSRVRTDAAATVADSQIEVNGDLSVRSNSTPISNARTAANAFSAGLISAAASGSIAFALLDPENEASVVGNSVTGNDDPDTLAIERAGRVTVFASTTPSASSDAAAFSISFGAAVGVSRADTTMSGETNAIVDSADNLILADSLDVLARTLSGPPNSNPSTAFAKGSSGGFLLGVTSTEAYLNNTMETVARIADGSVLDIAGRTRVEATAESESRVTGNSLGFGIFAAAGATRTESNVSMQTRAEIGSDVQLTGGSLLIEASGEDNNRATSIAGSGALVSGTSVSVGTATDSASIVRIGGGDTAAITLSGDLRADADQHADYNSRLQATSGGLLTGAGGVVRNAATPAAGVVIGENANLQADDISLIANTEVTKFSGSDGGVQATAGGAIAGVGMESFLGNALQAVVDIGAGASIRTHDGDGSAGNLNLAARNRFSIRDNQRMDAGGVAAGGDFRTRSLADVQGRIRIGADANLDIAGRISGRAESRGSNEVFNAAQVYGGATLSSGLLNVQIRAADLIAIGDRAVLRAGDDISFSAGTRDYNALASLDSYADAFIPVDGQFNSSAEIDANHAIITGAESQLLSAGDILLDAEDRESSGVRAIAKQGSWVNSVEDFFANLIGQGGEERIAGDTISRTDSRVVIDGEVRTGIDRDRFLTITDVTSVLPPEGQPDAPENHTVTAQGNIGFTKELIPLQTSLTTELVNAIRDRDAFPDNELLQQYYQSRIDAIQADLAQQGLAIDNGDGFDTVDRTVLSLSIDPIFMRKAGSIRVSSDQFGGTGSLDASGDARIDILNDTPAFIRLGQISLPDLTGGLFYNGRELSGDGESTVAQMNASLSASNLLRSLLSGVALVQADFSSIEGSANTTEPIVRVENRADISLLQLQNPENVYAWPGITVDGAIRNAGGTVELRTFETGAGTISVNEPILAGRQILDAGNFGTAFIDLEDAETRADDGTTTYELESEYARLMDAVDINNDFNGTSPVERNGSNPLLTDYFDRDPRVALQANQVFIRAEYINVNSIIQSGRSEYSLTIGQETADEIEGLRNAMTGGEGADTGPRIVALQTLSDQDFRAFYDLDNERILVQEFTPSGGLVDLTGNVANTHNGEIRVSGDRSKITIDNRTDYDIQINRIDSSRVGIGTVIIKDPGKDNSFTLYEKKGETVEVTTGQLDTDAENNIETFTGQTDFVYQPRDGLRYGWVIADGLIEQKQDIYGGVSVRENVFAAGNLATPGVFTPIDASLEELPFFYDDPDNPTRYEYTFDDLPSSTTSRDVIRASIGIPGVIEFWTGIRTITRVDRNLHTHTIKADRPIDVRFFGQSEGEIILNSLGSVHLNGALIAGSGRIDIDTSGELRQQASSGVIVASEIEIDAGKQVGTAEQPLRTDVSATSLARVHVWTDDGDIHLHEIDGDLPVEWIRGNRFGQSENRGDVFLRAQGSIINGSAPGFVDGNAVELVAETGSIGGLSRRLGVDAGFFNEIKDPAHQLTALAATDINIQHFSSLIVDEIRAGGTVRLAAAGRDANLIDGNTSEVRDERDLEELQNGVWAALQLTDGFGAQEKIDGRIALLEQSRTREYFSYWDLRATQADTNVYDPNHRVKLTPDEVAFYDDAAVIETLEDSRTQQYHTLHETYGALGDTRDDDYVYEATAEEREQIRGSIKVWTEDELLSMRPARDLVEITDSEFAIEAPNIRATNVQLDIGGGIGRYENGATINLTAPEGQSPIVSLDEVALIQTAEPNDIVYLQAEPVEVLAELANDSIRLEDETLFWADLGFRVGQSVFLESNTRDTTDEGRFLEIVEIDGDVMRVNIEFIPGGLQPDRPRNVLIAPAETDPAKFGEAPFLRVLRREDIDIEATGLVSAVSQRHVYIGSESDLNLTKVVAGDNQIVPQRVQIKAEGNVLDASGDDSPLIVGGRVVVEASAGSVGSLESPIVIDSSGYVIARAQDDIVIRQTSSGGELRDLIVNQIFSRDGLVDVATDGSVVAYFQEPRIELAAADLVIRAGGAIGTESRPLGVRTIGGHLTASGEDDVRLRSTTDELGIRQIISAGGDVLIDSEGAILDRVDVVDPYDPSSPDADPVPGNPAADIIGDNVILISQFGTIGTAGNELDIDSNRSGATQSAGTVSADAALNLYVNEVTGDLLLEAVRTPETAFLAALDGGILDVADNVMSVTVGKLWMFATDDIGASINPLSIDADNIEAISTSGDLRFSADAPIVVGGVVEGSEMAEGESAATPSRFGDGIQVAGEFFFVSRDAIEILEDIVANGTITVGPGKRLALPFGVQLKSAQRINLYTPFPALSLDVEILGSLDSPVNTVRASNRDDTLTVQPSSLTGSLSIDGSRGNDMITGSRFAERIEGGDGDDTIIGGAGCDEIIGGEGFDSLVDLEPCEIVGTVQLPDIPIDEDTNTRFPIASFLLEGLDPGDSVAHELIADPESLFSISGNELFFQDTRERNRREDYTASITVQTTRAQGGVTQETFSVVVSADNDPPRAVRMRPVGSDPNYFPEPFSNLIYTGGVTERVSGGPIDLVQVYDPEGDFEFDFVSTDPRFVIEQGILSLRPGEFVTAEEAPLIPMIGRFLRFDILVTDQHDPASQATLPLTVSVFVNPLPWQNPTNVFDVNRDTVVSALDALAVINGIARGASEFIDAIGNLDEARPFDLGFFDVTGDNRLTSLDALRVINQLARDQRSLSEGERESFTDGNVASPPGVDRLPGQGGSRSVRSHEPLLPHQVDSLFAAPSGELSWADWPSPVTDSSGPRTLSSVENSPSQETGESVSRLETLEATALLDEIHRLGQPHFNEP